MRSQDHLPLSFTFEQHSIHIIRRSGQAWFVSADLFTALKLPNTPYLMAGLAEHEVVRTLLPDAESPQGVLLVSESGLYFLMKQAERPRLKRFTRWLLRTVLPAIQETTTPANRPPRTLYDLDYFEDLRHDHTKHANVAWWRFKRFGAEAGLDDSEQGRHFFHQTHQLAKTNPQEAEEALTYSLTYLMGGIVRGYGIHGCELAFCRLVSRATVSWMRQHSVGAWPPCYGES